MQLILMVHIILVKNVYKKFHDNKSTERILTTSEKNSIEIYNYWDLKLYEEIYKNK